MLHGEFIKSFAQIWKFLIEKMHLFIRNTYNKTNFSTEQLCNYGIKSWIFETRESISEIPG